MPPVPPTEGRTLQAVGARAMGGQPIDPKALIVSLRTLATEGEGLVSLFDARAIAGEAHLLSAWAHLGRARARGESRLRDRGAELALYVAGDDQLPRALQKVGIRPDTTGFVLVLEKPRSIPEVLSRLRLELAPDVYPRAVDADMLERLGIPAAERATVPEAAWEGLVLERVAMLELGGAGAAVSAPAEPPTSKPAHRTPKD